MKKSKLVSFAKNNLSKKLLTKVKGGYIATNCCDCSCAQSASGDGCISGSGTSKPN